MQNSWGSGWGECGVARWFYEDWLENMRDAWVVRLALSTPQLYNLVPSAGKEGLSTILGKCPSRPFTEDDLRY